MRKATKQEKRVEVRYPIPGDLTEMYISKIMGLPSSVKSDYLKSVFLSKYYSPDTDPPLLRRTRAIEKWLGVERTNEETAERLTNTDPEYQLLPSVSFGDFVEFCTSLIARIIGDTPPSEALIGSFSGGASTSRPRTASHPAAKYVGKAHVTSRACEVFDLAASLMPLWYDADSVRGFTDRFVNREIVPGNVLFTVPKKTDIDRVACKEPDQNMFIQKGIGRHFRASLRRNKINLNDQSINRSLAHRGSVTGELATLDLSNASDSVTRELVFTMLPVTWFTLLDSVRSPVTIIDGEEHLNEMFSSMGNGFTFELESLLFYAIARSVARFEGVRGIISVYGDDLICPTGMAHQLSEVLNYFGFQVNPDKSYIEGPFRESCGGHYHNGVDITPFYLRAPISTMADLIHQANSVREWARWIEPHQTIDSRQWYGVLDPQVEDLWLWLKSFIPDDLWGGVDTSFKYQLVSNDTPKYRLSEETVSKGTGYGGYLHWHNTNWERAELGMESVQTSRRTDGTSRFRLKKARISTVDRVVSLFSHEFGVTPDLSS